MHPKIYQERWQISFCKRNLSNFHHLGSEPFSPQLVKNPVQFLHLIPLAVLVSLHLHWIRLKVVKNASSSGRWGDELFKGCELKGETNSKEIPLYTRPPPQARTIKLRIARMALVE